LIAFPPIPTDPNPAAGPTAVQQGNSPVFLQEQESHRRAMPLQRLLGGGMRYADAVALHEMASLGVTWDTGAEWLGERNVRLAAAASTKVTARECFRFASACYRFGHSAIARDTDRKRQMYRRMVDAYAKAAKLDHPETEKHEIPWRNGSLCGWLMRPCHPGLPPVVMVIGGFDGWREEYALGAAALLERGLAVFLLDGPGQGETRLIHLVYLDTDFHEAFAAAAEYLRQRLGSRLRVGIWGNSLGGFLAAKTAATHSSFAALCVNGGTMRPMELPERHPRFMGKVEALVGSAEPERVLAIMQQLDLSADVSEIRCPLLQLHSPIDSVFMLANARPIHDRASSTDKTLLIWQDGDHCIYNHWEEKNMAVADWFAARLGQSHAS
jgi:dipeptidyl aminopeptidase/acylaminoacyl peptidase